MENPKCCRIHYSIMSLSSIVISVMVAMILFLVIAAGSAISSFDKDSPALVVLGLVVLILFIVDSLALGVGIVDIIENKPVCVLSIIGVALSAATIIGTIVLYVIGSISG